MPNTSVSTTSTGSTASSGSGSGGGAWLLGDQSSRQPVQLRLTDDSLYVQKPKATSINSSPLNTNDLPFSNKERRVEIKRQRPGGLGLSVKGGSEHNLPILISRIFKDQAADRTGKLFVGDAILQVNGIGVDTFYHDEAVTVLKNAGDTVVLIVKHFHPASNYLATAIASSTKDNGNTNTLHKDSESNACGKGGRVEENGNCLTLSKRTSLVTIPLLCAYISRFKLTSGKLSDDTFEVMSLDGSCVANIQFDDPRCCEDWLYNIYHNIVSQNNLSVSLTNKQLLPHKHVMHMCWVCEQSNSSAHTTLSRLFLSLKGPDVSFYEMPPVKTRDWVKCVKSYKIYECMFKIQKNYDPPGSGTGVFPNSFLLEPVDGVTQCFGVETYEELVKLEKAWYKATYHVVRHETSKTFGCTYAGRLCGLTLDFNEGFCLYDSHNKTCVWSYKFSQLKGSSDNGEKTLTLQFQNSSADQVDSWELETTELRRLLYCIHAFLSAKLASVDPIFLINIE